MLSAADTQATIFKHSRSPIGSNNEPIVLIGVRVRGWRSEQTVWQTTALRLDSTHRAGAQMSFPVRHTLIVRSASGACASL